MKKLLVILLLAGMLCSCIAGCAKPTTTPTDVTPVEVASTEESAESEASVLVTEAPKTESEEQSVVSVTAQQEKGESSAAKETSVASKEPSVASKVQPVESTVSSLLLVAHKLVYQWPAKHEVEQNESINQVCLCRSYEEYLDYLANGPMKLQTLDEDGNVTDKTQEYQGYYSKEYFEQNSLLLVLPRRWNTYETVTVPEIAVNAGELQVQVKNNRHRQYGMAYPAVVPSPEIYVVEIEAPLEKISTVTIEFCLETSAEQEDGTVVVKNRETQTYQFPVS